LAEAHHEIRQVRVVRLVDVDQELLERARGGLELGANPDELGLLGVELGRGLVELGLLHRQVVLGRRLLLSQLRLPPDQLVDLRVHAVDLGAQRALVGLNPAELVLLLGDLGRRIADRALSE